MARKQPASPNAAFLKAVRDGDFESLPYHVEDKGASLDARDENGRSAMHIAAERGFTRCIEKLIELGANIDVQDRNLETPLHIAARQTHGVDTSSFLILHGADVSIKNRFGDTPFTLVKQENRLKEVLRAAWLSALDKNPLDMNIVTEQDIVIAKPVAFKRRGAPPAP
ncbi:MAG: ankyrin repeat domain-containing protein [Bdellovibrionales bacterium]|nr:ankyrin repeat domain-containing protein [Bdellovibrionales bacterium]